jgi:hypothetical protein
MTTVYRKILELTVANRFKCQANEPFSERNVATEWVALLLSVREVPGSDLP